MMQRLAPASKEQQEPANDDQPIQGPAVITQLHVQDRETSTVAGAPRAWRRLSQLEHAYHLERLGARDSGEARDRLDAGRTFTTIWDAAYSAGSDSTQAIGSPGVFRKLPFSERQREALRRLAAIELHLGVRDITILRAVLAHGHSPKEAIALARLCKDTRVTARFCEALDSLADAIERTEKSGPRWA